MHCVLVCSGLPKGNTSPVLMGSLSSHSSCLQILRLNLFYFVYTSIHSDVSTYIYVYITTLKLVLSTREGWGK